MYGRDPETLEVSLQLPLRKQEWSEGLEEQSREQSRDQSSPAFHNSDPAKCSAVQRARCTRVTFHAPLGVPLCLQLSFSTLKRLPLQPGNAGILFSVVYFNL